MVVYGANDVSARRELWQGFIELAVIVGNVPWLVGGDFNAVLDMSAVSGASGDIRVAMNEFNDCILQTGLLSLPMQGKRFTWHNCSLDGRSLWKRLDRLLVNDVWMDRWPNLFYTCLTPRTSDHSPLVLKGDCRNMQPVFRQQRRCKGDLVMNVKLAAGFLEVAQNILQFDRHNSRRLLLEHCCRLVYLKASKLEQFMLRQRAKLQWLKGGDQCSKVFFCRVATRKANKRVFQIFDDDGNEQTDPTIICSIFVDFFQGLLGGDRTDKTIDLQYLRPWARHILTDDEARAIIRPVTIDEVKTTFFDIEEDKAPGPDGFSSGFFKAAWPVVGEEVSNAIIEFFKTGRLLKQLNATLLTLIPKNAFVPGRLISDNVLLAQELFSGYNQCRFPPRCALKVDLRKVFDTVEWDFLMCLIAELASQNSRNEEPSRNAQDCSPNLESIPSSTVQDGLLVHPDIYIGNVKLQSDFVDNIAGAFLQSSHKTLHFVPPTRQNGEIIIRPTKEVVDNGSKKWQSTAVGYFLERRPYFPQLETFARSNWKGLQHVSASSSGLFFFRFHNRMAMEDVIEGGPWLFQGQPIVLQSWEQGMSLRRQKHTQIPVWIRLKHLSMEYWTDEGLSTVASGIGTPFPVLRNGKEDPKRIDVEYEWLPQRCKNCCSLGHVAATYPANMKKNVAPPITIFVKKQTPQPDSKRPESTRSVEGPRPAASSGASGIKKGKEMVLYNSYSALDTEFTKDAELIVDEDNQSTGPNNCSPTVGGS
ncbi:hypothetical protein Sango_2797700 [Sesamum angolense]|uniref:DUF4283 domain-containing protein n=1 Tax=Sesamum angolense TaxID=2727404 RepID=A0AAE1W0U5_9LAMI|nr:hypothetical protein Sango_2797700 [Sesamum angolense]